MQRCRWFTHLQFTVAHALGFSVFTIRLLATDLNTETSTSNHYGVLLPFLVQSPWNLGTQLKLRLLLTHPAYCFSFGILLTYTYSCSTDTHHRKHMSRVRYPASPLARWLDLQKKHHVTVTQLVHWRADCCLAMSYDIRPLRHSFHCCAL
jgi:hypothetical protein